MNIKVFSAPHCSACDTTKRVLRKANLPFTEVDVTADESAMAQCKDMGFSELPVVIAGSESWSGFRYEMLRKLTA